MDNQLANVLFSYIRDEVALQAIHDWLATNVWLLSGEAQELADEIGAELAYIDDGYSDEDQFRLRTLNILQRLGIIDRTHCDNPSDVVTGATNSTLRTKVAPPSFAILSLQTVPTGA